MNTENSITNESNKFSYYFTKKLNLKDPNKNIALVNLSIYNNITAYNNNKLKISASTWNDLFDLPDGSYSVSDIQGCFECIITKHEAVVDNLPMQIYIKMKNCVMFKIKTSYKLEVLSKETMKLLGSIKKVIAKDKNGENIPKLEIEDVILMHCNLVNNK